MAVGDTAWQQASAALEALGATDHLGAPLARLQAVAWSFAADDWGQGLPALDAVPLAAGRPVLDGRELALSRGQLAAYLAALAAAASGLPEAEASAGALRGWRARPVGGHRRGGGAGPRAAGRPGCRARPGTGSARVARPARRRCRSCRLVGAPLGPCWRRLGNGGAVGARCAVPGRCWPRCAAKTAAAGCIAGAAVPAGATRTWSAPSAGKRSTASRVTWRWQASARRGAPLSALRCGSYLKSIAAPLALAPPEAALADLRTLDLDLAALERGYRRPDRPPAPPSVVVRVY